MCTCQLFTKIVSFVCFIHSRGFGTQLEFLRLFICSMISLLIIGFSLSKTHLNCLLPTALNLFICQKRISPCTSSLDLSICPERISLVCGSYIEPGQVFPQLAGNNPRVPGSLTIIAIVVIVVIVVIAAVIVVILVIIAATVIIKLAFKRMTLFRQYHLKYNSISMSLVLFFFQFS